MNVLHRPRRLRVSLSVVKTGVRQGQQLFHIKRITGRHHLAVHIAYVFQLAVVRLQLLALHARLVIDRLLIFGSWWLKAQTGVVNALMCSELTFWFVFLEGIEGLTEGSLASPMDNLTFGRPTFTNTQTQLICQMIGILLQLIVQYREFPFESYHHVEAWRLHNDASALKDRGDS